MSLTLAFVMSLAAGMVGCDQSPASRGRPARESPQPRAESPADMVGRLQQAYKQRDYAAIAPLLVSTRRAATIDLLAAVDEVLIANRRLRDVAEAVYQGPVSETWSIGQLENNLGPFSAKVTLIGQELRGEDAIVILQEGDHIPLFKARFVNTADGWLYDAEPFPAAMIGEMRRLASTLDEVTEDVRKGADVRYYLDVFFSRVAPQMCRVLTAADPVSQTARAGTEADSP